MSKESTNMQTADNTAPVDINPEQTTALGQNNHELLNDITMELTVEIGRAEIKISDLLNLSKGTVIHLDQQADEPLSIYANNKLIAKGHIIASNGKYSIRVI
jgi:flagellar motor switch protein FliN/FliY